MIDVLFYVLLVGGAVGAAGALVIASSVSHNLTVWRGESFLTLLPYCMMGLSAIAAVTSDRDLAQMLTTAAASEARHPASIWATRLTSVALVLVSLHLIAVKFFSKSELSSRLPLLVAFVILWTTTVLSPAVAGYRPVLSHEYLYCLIIGSALILFSMSTGLKLVSDTRDAILVFIFLALIVIPIVPSMVLDLGYARGLIPGLPRFAGFASHPVSMGLIGLVGTLCWISCKYERRWMNVFAGIVFFSGLFLAQSKTSWLAAILAITILKVFSNYRLMFIEPWRDSHRKNWIVILSLFVGLVLTLLLVTISGILPTAIDNFVNSPKGAELISLTGRSEIWLVALEEWRAHPVFGYGPSIFNESYRVSIGMTYATHGHNELIDTLARSGSVGGLGVIVYYLVLSYYAIRTAVATRGLSIALWVLVTLQCVSEVPLQLFRYGPETLPHFLLLGVVASHIAQRSKKSVNSRYDSRLTPNGGSVQAV